MGTSHEDQFTFSILLLSVLPRKRHFSDKTFREKKNTFYVQSPVFKNHVIMLKNTVALQRP
jgi:hypothetical protein